MSSAKGPLDGIRIIDFTHVIAGPYCTMLLADAGADVIKIEPPGGEYGRVRGPKRTGVDGATLSSYGAAVSRGKRDVVLDLKNNFGRTLARSLVERSDVLVENFSPGTMGRLGLSLNDLRANQPALITASISLWGSRETAGHLAGQGGLSLVAESEGSVGFMVRDKEGSPVPLRVPVADVASGLSAYGAILTALYERTTTGVGQHLDIPMVRTMLSFNSVNIAGIQMPSADLDEGVPAALGIFPARDGFVAIGVNTDKMWQRLVVGMGMPELADDPRFASFGARDKRVEEVNAVLSEWTRGRDANEIVDLLAPSGLPCGRLSSPEDVLIDRKYRELGWLWLIDDGIGGSIELPANPVGPRFGEEFLPQLGQHTEEVLEEVLGLASSDVSQLSLQGAFGQVDQ